MGLPGKPEPAPSTGGFLQARLASGVETNIKLIIDHAPGVGDARVSALHNIVREPYRTALIPLEASVGVLPTKTFQWHANKNEGIPGTDQERYALPVRRQPIRVMREGARPISWSNTFRECDT
jgi:hypothetical protein